MIGKTPKARNAVRSLISGACEKFTAAAVAVGFLRPAFDEAVTARLPSLGGALVTAVVLLATAIYIQSRTEDE